MSWDEKIIEGFAEALDTVTLDSLNRVAIFRSLIVAFEEYMDSGKYTPEDIFSLYQSVVRKMEEKRA